jgi:hypothetical protein
MQVNSAADYYSRLDALKGWCLKQIAGGVVPATVFYDQLELPPLNVVSDEQAFSLEIVSHCWQYAHLLRYQLSSIVLHAPSDINITVTVYYCKSDQDTVTTLSYFETFKQANIHWNWQPFPKEYLYRRSIGRNHAALNTQADWIWFTDCDSIFHKHCFSSLAQQLRKLQTPLVFPYIEHRSRPLPAEHSDLRFDATNPALIDIAPEDFVATEITRATGPLQIVHCDVARKLGYCQQSVIYQKPARQWCKALEDRIFRWLLGTQGVGMPIEGVYRIQHQEKGRYTKGSGWSWIREHTQNFKTKAWLAKAKPTRSAQSAKAGNE